MPELSREQIDTLNRLIDQADHMADFERQMAQAYRCGLLSRGPRSAGDLHLETVASIERHRQRAAGSDQLRDALIRIRDGEIDYL